MKINDFIKLYEEVKQKEGDNAYKHISAIFDKAQKIHQKHAKKAGKDIGQSWRSTKGKNFEKLVVYIIEDAIKQLGLEVIDGNKLERYITKRRDETEDNSTYNCLREKLMVEYHINHSHLPDADIVIYEPSNNRVIAIISCKVTLRERIAQTGYWKLKLVAQKSTENIKVCFVTLDEDGSLIRNNNQHNKSRVIAENDIDGSYIISKEDFVETKNIKDFSKLIEDIKEWI